MLHSDPSHGLFNLFYDVTGLVTLNQQAVDWVGVTIKLPLSNHTNVSYENVTWAQCRVRFKSRLLSRSFRWIYERPKYLYLLQDNRSGQP